MKNVGHIGTCDVHSYSDPKVFPNSNAESCSTGYPVGTTIIFFLIVYTKNPRHLKLKHSKTKT